MRWRFLFGKSFVFVRLHHTGDTVLVSQTQMMRRLNILIAEKLWILSSGGCCVAAAVLRSLCCCSCGKVVVLSWPPLCCGCE